MTIAERLTRVRRQIDAAARSTGRDPAEVCLVAVSKFHSVAAVREAYVAGQRVFGENYVQELLAKQQATLDLEELRWHFIGHLQRNKAKQVVGRVEVIETIDSLQLLEELEKRAAAVAVEVGVLIQVNIGNEDTKSGCTPGELGELLQVARANSWVRPRGLMVLPPYELDEEEARPYFRGLRELRDQHGGAELLPELSMGMSHDFEVAIEEGSTLVRVGTAIFGSRSAP